MTRFDRTPNKTQRAQALRNGMPGAERKLWAKLKGKQVGGFRFRRQHPVGVYILDFYCPEVRLCIELDGDQHAEAQAIKRDQTRTSFLEQKGICVIRFWNAEVFENLEGVVETIYAHAANLKREAEMMRDGTPSP